MDEVVNALKAQGLVSGAQKALLARVATQNPAPRPPASQSSPSGNETIYRPCPFSLQERHRS